MTDSRKFKAMAVDAIFSILAVVVTYALDPDFVDPILKVLALAQPVMLAYVLGVAIEDAALKRTGALPEKPSDK